MIIAAFSAVWFRSLQNHFKLLIVIYVRKYSDITSAYTLIWQDSFHVTRLKAGAAYDKMRGRGTTSTSDIPSPLTPNILSQPQILKRQKSSFSHLKMHLYRSLNSYDGEYLKREKCFIDLWDKHVFAVYLQAVMLQGYSTTFTTLVYSKHPDVINTLKKKIHLVMCVDQYCECAISVLSTQNLCRDSSNFSPKWTESSVSQCWIRFHFF